MIIFCLNLHWGKYATGKAMYYSYFILLDMTLFHSLANGYRCVSPLHAGCLG
uniref:Uncharacterized protein n=1 Tax=Arundo donax TaxID=35708 RepID=A0A0A9HBU4_ARUDO